MRKLMIGLAVLMTVGAAIPVGAHPIDQRANRQEQRIRQGERTGALTPAEARQLQYREMRLRRTEARLRWRNGGRLTPRERHRLLAMERHDSRTIYRMKHNYRHY